MAYTNFAFHGEVDELGFSGEVFFQLHPAEKCKYNKRNFLEAAFSFCI